MTPKTLIVSDYDVEKLLRSRAFVALGSDGQWLWASLSMGPLKVADQGPRKELFLHSPSGEDMMCTIPCNEEQGWFP
jgi:hypothetical protein